jgi:adenylosuccinate synthase
MKAIAVVGLGFGDEGKGTIVDWLTREHGADLVVRYCGGAQAAHHVVLPDGRWHRFSQWGAGTLANPELRTFLHRNMIVEPYAMIDEAKHLETLGIDQPFRLLHVDPNCLIATTLHRAVNRVRERRRGEDRHGSCGMGIGECRSYELTYPGDGLRFRDLWNESTMKEKLDLMAKRYAREFTPEGNPEINISTAHWMDSQFYKHVHRLAHCGDCPSAEMAIFEGSQGTLLDENFGFAPHTTWSSVTSSVAVAVADELGVSDLTVIGVTRSYHSRHGAGPFPSETAELSYLAKHDHNQPGEFQGAMRYGHLDFDLLKYAVDCNPHLNGVAVTCLDQLDCDLAAVNEIIPVLATSRSPTFEGKVWC